MKSSRRPNRYGVLHWLDALATGACTEQEFLLRLQTLEVDEPYVAWEALSLTDQHFQGNRISREVFTAMKTRFQHHLQDFRQPGETIRSEIATGINEVIGKEAPVERKAEAPGAAPAICKVMDEQASRDAELLRIGRMKALLHPAIVRVDVGEKQRAPVFKVASRAPAARTWSLPSLVPAPARMRLATWAAAGIAAVAVGGSGYLNPARDALSASHAEVAEAAPMPQARVSQVKPELEGVAVSPPANSMDVALRCCEELVLLDSGTFVRHSAMSEFSGEGGGAGLKLALAGAD